MRMKGLVLLLALALVFPAMAKKISAVRKAGQVCTTCHQLSNKKIPVIAGKAYCSRQCFVCTTCHIVCRGKYFVMEKNIYCSKKCISLAKKLNKANKKRVAGNALWNVDYDCNGGTFNKCAACAGNISARDAKNGMICSRCRTKAARLQNNVQRNTVYSSENVTVTTKVEKETVVNRKNTRTAKPTVITGAANHQKNTRTAKPTVITGAANHQKNTRTAKPTVITGAANRQKNTRTAKPTVVAGVVNRQNTRAAKPTVVVGAANRQKNTRTAKPTVIAGAVNHQQITRTAKPTAHRPAVVRNGNRLAIPEGHIPAVNRNGL